jgi:hypothetical protein
MASGRLKFSVESKAFAECLRLEHEAVGVLLDEMVPGQDRDGQSEAVVALRAAHVAVTHQKRRVVAAYGVRRG